MKSLNAVLLSLVAVLLASATCQGSVSVDPLSAASLHAACKQQFGLYSVEPALSSGYQFVTPADDEDIDLERCVTIASGPESGR
jgi:hypothetical protein